MKETARKFSISSPTEAMQATVIASAPIVASASRSSSPFLSTTRRHRVLAAAVVTTVTGIVAARYSRFPSLISPTTSRSPSIAARAMSSTSNSAATSILEAGAKPLPSHPRPTTVGPRSSPPPTALVFLMHGLGDTAAGWSDVAQMLSPALPYAKFVLPTAATQPVSERRDAHALVVRHPLSRVDLGP